MNAPVTKVATGSDPLQVEDGGPPRYRLVEDILCARIRDGVLKPGDRLNSTRTLAAEFDVGIGTVRQALGALASRGILTRRPRLGTIVSEAAQQAVTPAAPARISHPIYAVLVPDIRWPQYSGMIRGLQDILHKDAIHISVFSIENSVERCEEVIRRCVESHVDGLILVPPLFAPISLPVLSALQQSDIPVVTCWRSVAVPEWPVVRTDDFDNSYRITQRLIESGVQKIACIRDMVHSDVTDLPVIEPMKPSQDPIWQLAFERALRSAGLAVNEADFAVVNCGLEVYEPNGLSCQERIVDALTAWLKERPHIDGIMCTYDVVAGLVLLALDRLGRKVPDDVAVTGAGNLRAYSWHYPTNLTTIDPNMNLIAERIVALLHDIRDGKKFPPNHVEIIRSSIIEGDSTRLSQPK